MKTDKLRPATVAMYRSCNAVFDRWKQKAAHQAPISHDLLQEYIDDYYGAPDPATGKTRSDATVKQMLVRTTLRMIPNNIL